MSSSFWACLAALPFYRLSTLPLPMNYGSHPLPCLKLSSIVAILVMIASSQMAWAQVGLTGVPGAKKIVREVQVIIKGAVKLDENRIRSQMSTRVGQPFTDEAGERDMRTLYGTGAIENIEINAVDVPGGVKVIVEIIGRGQIAEILFVGNKSIDKAKLRKDVAVKV